MQPNVEGSPVLVSRERQTLFGGGGPNPPSWSLSGGEAVVLRVSAGSRVLGDSTPLSRFPIAEHSDRGWHPRGVSFCCSFLVDGRLATLLPHSVVYCFDHCGSRSPVLGLARFSYG